ncbi:hypothetical protein MESS2_1700017 [Mesorhizobium metallidurans STM 2683]|uniref:Uncharacterized protein n=1 Tax=Mesorhizobium metallidurans STM 2683 TaxID=1297569 RepID=M5EP21_9HYPH|nr:hypothetical protein [Mesorhizobium metallidurans]CCV05890.1 hypothetical protein MESS2_1700017 [Mesorhizobium metallidurans STM 2683]
MAHTGDDRFAGAFHRVGRDAFADDILVNYFQTTGNRGGYPWTVVRVDDRKPYLAGLEEASGNMNLKRFAAFLAERVRWSMGKAA